MENKEFEGLLKSSLTPSIPANPRVDQAILEKWENGGKEKGAVSQWKPRHFLPKAAAVVVAVAIAGVGTTYAAERIIDKIFGKIMVTEHGVSVGNELYVYDEELAKPAEDVTTESLGEETPGPGDKWLKKTQEVVSGRYHHTRYWYPDYLTAISDTRFESVFGKIPGKEQSVIYCYSDLGNDTWEYSINAIFDYKEGSVYVYQSVMEGNVAEDAAFSIQMSKTGNVRTYASKSGVEYALVDDLGSETVTTYVMLDCEDFQGYVSFQKLSEEEIHEVLDGLTVKGKES